MFDVQGTFVGEETGAKGWVLEVQSTAGNKV